MKYRRVGRTGLVVSEICVGGWIHIGGDIPDEDSTEIIRTAFRRGVTFFDTAEAYAAGRSEEVMGRALRDFPREELVIATKVSGAGANLSTTQGLSRKHILSACDGSLRRLGIDYIDLYQAHWPDPHVKLEETMCALNDLVRAGKVRHIGCSNFSAEQIYNSLEISAREGWARFDCVQPHYNLLSREFEEDLMPLCRLAGIGIIPYSPLAGGVLTGKYKAGGKVAPNTRAHKNPGFQKRLTKETLDKVSKLRRLAAARKKTVGQLSLAWLLSHPELTAPIVGPRNARQLKENLGGSGWRLREKELQEIARIVG
jgi:aryl-alcohol dehydrogenase-like predicted oxidoreductase